MDVVATAHSMLNVVLSQLVLAHLDEVVLVFVHLPEELSTPLSRWTRWGTWCNSGPSSVLQIIRANRQTCMRDLQIAA